MNQYIARMRKYVGHDKLFLPGVRVLIENEAGQVLLQLRRDNHQWGFPAGSMEEHETISTCIQREVTEETGLVLREFEVIGISSDPEFETVIYPNGDIVQYLTVVAYATSWEGELADSTEEAEQLAFFSLTDLPSLPLCERRSILNLIAYKSGERLKLY